MKQRHREMNGESDNAKVNAMNDAIKRQWSETAIHLDSLILVDELAFVVSEQDMLCIILQIKLIFRNAWAKWLSRQYNEIELFVALFLSLDRARIARESSEDFRFVTMRADHRRWDRRMSLTSECHH